MTAAVIRPNAEQRNEKVRAVLRNALRPMSPSQIAAAICEEWCCWDSKPAYAKSAAISPVLKRIGAVREIGGRGLWSLAADPAKAAK